MKYLPLLALMLGLHTAAAQTSPVPNTGLVLWLSAKDAVVQDGKVVSIKDQSGKGNDAKQDNVPRAVLTNPVLAKDEASGQPVLRFDGKNSSYSFQPVTDIRTVFWVASKNPAAFKQRFELFLLGGKTTKDFHVGTHYTDTMIENGANASKFLKEGKGWFNGFPMDPKVTEFSPKLAVTCMETTGNVIADQIARDRAFPDRCWNGDIAEILLYNVVLSETDRKAVEAYLLKKYAITPFQPVVVSLDSVIPGKTGPAQPK